MANTGLFDQSRAAAINMDEIVANSRSGYVFSPQAVNGGTIAANQLGTNWMNGTGSPTSTTPGATSTISAFMLSAGIMVVAPTTANTATFDTGANIVAMVNARSAGAVVGDIIQCLIVNGSGTNGITLAVPASGAFDTNQTNRAIAVNTSRYVFIRLTNVTPGSEAYTVYF